jgi:hypothetical protein
VICGHLEDRDALKEGPESLKERCKLLQLKLR